MSTRILWNMDIGRWSFWLMDNPNPWRFGMQEFDGAFGVEVIRIIDFGPWTIEVWRCKETA